jgi:uncharacterized protein
MMLSICKLLLVTFNFVALGTNLVSMPGNWLMLTFTWLFALWQWDKRIFSLPTLIVITVLAIAGDLAELFSSKHFVKRSGGSKQAAKGAILGAILFGIFGTFLLPIPFVGSAAGTCLGALVGAMFMEMRGGKNANDSLRAGIGAGVGQFLGMNLKTAVGVLIWIITCIAVFWN